MIRKKAKTYKLKLYEMEILDLYDLLLSLNKGRMPLTESKLKAIIDKYPEFRAWDDVVKAWENRKR